MEKLMWKVQSVNNVLIPGPPEQQAWIVTLGVQVGGTVQAGQLVLRLPAAPTYHPGDTIEVPQTAPAPPAKPK